MSTGRYFVCEKCNRERWIPSLFDALRDAAQGKLPSCSCGQTERLRLDFPFGIGAGVHKFYLIAAYFPNNPVNWKDDKDKKVEHYPFLVVMEEVHNRSNRGVWLPYWHLHYKRDMPHKKYGQWAPHMDVAVFAALVEKAKKGGYI